jgi:ATP synthase F1 gamma subunit
MAEDKKIKERIETNEGFDLLTRSYQEHAVGQINFARFSVLYSRGYANDLAEIFSNVKTSYVKGLTLKENKGPVKKNGKDLWILLTANNKLYGDIITKTCQFFLSHLRSTRKENTDIAIIGRQGKNFIDESRIDWPYRYVEIPDTNVKVDYLKDLLTELIKYENIYVFYARYDNLISQTPVQAILSGEINIENTSEKSSSPADKKGWSDFIATDNTKKQKYLFEPGINEIMSFFENQILSLLLNQTVQEGQLARFASRINAMETAQSNIHKQLENLKMEEKLFKMKSINKKQLELMAGRKLWNKK